MAPIRPYRILMAENRHGNTASRARGAEKGGCEVRWAQPYWSEGLGPISMRLQFLSRTGPAIVRWNARILEIAQEFKPEIVWVESPLFVFPETYAALKEKWGSTLVCAYSDDPRDPKKRSRHFEESKKLLDIVFATKDQLAQELLTEGVRAVGKFWKGYDPERIYPIKAEGGRSKLNQSDIIFIGHPDVVKGKSARLHIMEALSEHFDGLRVYGKRWGSIVTTTSLRNKISPRQLDGQDYPAMISGSSIALQIPSRLAQDTHSSRSVEIPACGTLMIAERTVDHQVLFEEDREAVFFSSTEELVNKCDYYLRNVRAARRIADAGYARCQKSGYSNELRMLEMLRLVTAFREKIW